MSGLERTMAAARRGAAWLLPADRRELIDPALPTDAMLPAESADAIDPVLRVGRCSGAGVGFCVMRIPARR